MNSIIRLLIGVLPHIHGQLAPSDREGSQIEYPIQGLLFPDNMLKGQGVDSPPGPLVHISSEDFFQFR